MVLGEIIQTSVSLLNDARELTCYFENWKREINIYLCFYTDVPQHNQMVNERKFFFITVFWPINEEGIIEYHHFAALINGPGQ